MRWIVGANAGPPPRLRALLRLNRKPVGRGGDGFGRCEAPVDPLCGKRRADTPLVRRVGPCSWSKEGQDGQVCYTASSTLT